MPVFYFKEAKKKEKKMGLILSALHLERGQYVIPLFYALILDFCPGC